MIEFIKMCEKAVEVQQRFQENHLSLRPSFLYDFLLERVCIYVWMPSTTKQMINPKSKYDSLTLSIESTRDAGIRIDETEGPVLWLPSQSQLQKMLLGDGQAAVANLITDFNSWFEYHGCYEWSMEQLWLAYVMHEKYNKAWNGQDWELIT